MPKPKAVAVNTLDIAGWTSNGQPLPCHGCGEPLDIKTTKAETIDTIMGPVKVHTACAETYRTRMAYLMQGFFGTTNISDVRAREKIAKSSICPLK